MASTFKYAQTRCQKSEIHDVLLSIVVALGVLFVILFVGARTQDARIDVPDDGPGAFIKGVVELDADNYSNVIGQSKYVLVEFYANWCGYCHAFVSEYTYLSERLQDDPILGGKVVLAKMDNRRVGSLASAFKFTGYPTLYLVPPHEQSGKEYTGNHRSDDIYKFLKQSVV
ncbi:Thioredoxin domain [Trypanosoma melophagium]|uniref:Thioredoxin domain n=1 Tax=Trypanosoma melophagium TaxID=715481 RepID=UPI00351A6F8D|nr:Thioredoxin domain [Trypanosoma melophagium]